MPAGVMPQVAQPRAFPQPLLARASMRTVKCRVRRDAEDEERAVLQSSEHAYLIQRRLKDSIYGVLVLASRVDWSAAHGCYLLAEGVPSVAVKVYSRGACCRQP